MSRVKPGYGIEFGDLCDLLGIDAHFVLETFDVNPGDAVGEISCEVQTNKDCNFEKITENFIIKIASEIVIRLAAEKQPSELINFDDYDSSCFGRHINEIAEDLAFAFVCKQCEKFRWYVECRPNVTEKGGEE